MTTKIKPKFSNKYDYSNTLFAELEIEIKSVGHLTPRPWINRTYWLADRRYNPVRRGWTLDGFIALLEKAASFGPVEPNVPEDHGPFIVVKPRPEDELLEIKPDGVFLKDWWPEPIYKRGQIEMLTDAIKRLEEVRQFLKNKPAGS